MIIDLLNKVKEEIEADSEIFSKITKGEEFEEYVTTKFIHHSKASSNVTVEFNGKHAFPDLSITLPGEKKYGIEVKFSASGNWRSKGNSVFETQSNKSIDKGYEEIYVFYGRKPKLKEDTSFIKVKWASYGASIDRVEVTHSPRFSINMGDEENNLESFFGDLTYASFRILENDVKREKLQKHFQEISQSKGGNKWYLPQLSEENPEHVSPTIFSSLDMSDKDKIIAESFILFPFDLFRPQANYQNVAVNMITKYFVYSTSLRDCFSSKGKVQIFNTEKTQYPRMLKRFKDLEKNIKVILEENDSDEFKDKCLQVWKKQIKELKLKNINIKEQDSLKTSYEKIITNFKPYMKVREVAGKKEINKQLDLKKFYTI